MLLLAGLIGAAWADDGDLTAVVTGDVKSFYVANFPYDSPLFPSEPSGFGVLDGRLKLDAHYRDVLRLEVHHAVTFMPGGGAGVGALQTGVAPSAPQAVNLTWVGVDNDALRVQGRTDRLVLTLSAPHVNVAVGRQPISFGSGVFFTPLDLVNPFTPAVIDQEYKPGVDAVRVDAYAGMSGQITAVAAYHGDWSANGVVVGALGKGTVGVTELGGFVGLVRGDAVLGGMITSSIGAIGLHGDLTVTRPHSGDVFVRGVAGADWRPFSTTTLSGEVYVQTLGGAQPSDYLAMAASSRFASGELWLMGRTYAGVAWVQEITPLVSANLAVLANLEDPSALATPNLSWSVAENATLAVGGFLGLGRRPDGLTLQSEFGTYPITGFAQVRTYF